MSLKRIFVFVDSQLCLFVQLYYPMDKEEGFKRSDYLNVDKVTAFLRRVSAGEVPYIHILNWYNPTRYFNLVSKYMNKMDDSTLQLFTMFCVGSFILFGIIAFLLVSSANETPKKKN